ncbi:(Fe-S)-binding protein [Anaeropeptidivorans aminofermentans]|uniref:(Fe-S)-binding protein n=1 Tax=Anaeropeptidivorans aminofermentans TaxID=2934315 RepID=UPI002023DCFB|nr:(Fe-S)-binding protein [Anaeropeptidivorans aminofermentans]
MSHGNLVVKWNQALSFSPLMAKSTKGPSVFWPGCAALKLDSAFIGNAYNILKRSVPQLGFSSFCCGKPTFAVGIEKEKDKKNILLSKYFKEYGINTIYTLCPNCKLTLENKYNINVIPAWPVIAENLRADDKKDKIFKDTYILHDPCASREDKASHEAIRQILSYFEIDFQEFTHCKEKAQCCGRKNMIFLTEPETSKKMLQNRIKDANNLPIITYCESCVEAFREGHKEAFHILELIDGSFSERSFLNRINNANKFKN